MTQAANTTPETRLKAERLTILNITDRQAIVEGDHSDYIVSFRGMTCTCPAGLMGMKCSHCQAAIKERARMHGYEFTAFSPNMQHAEAYAAMQRKAGKKAVTHFDSGYFYTTSGNPIEVKATRPQRSHDAIQASADSLF